MWEADMPVYMIHRKPYTFSTLPCTLCSSNIELILNSELVWDFDISLQNAIQRHNLYDNTPISNLCDVMLIDEFNVFIALLTVTLLFHSSTYLTTFMTRPYISPCFEYPPPPHSIHHSSGCRMKLQYFNSTSSGWHLSTVHCLRYSLPFECLHGSIEA